MANLKFFEPVKTIVNASTLAYKNEKRPKAPTYEEGLSEYDRFNYFYGGSAGGGMSRSPLFPGMDGKTT